MASEINMLAHRLDRISEKHRSSRDFTLGSLTTRPARDHRGLPRLPDLRRRAGRRPERPTAPDGRRQRRPCTARPRVHRARGRGRQAAHADHERAGLRLDPRRPHAALPGVGAPRPTAPSGWTSSCASSRSPGRSPPRASRTPSSTASTGWSRSTRWAATPAASAPRSPSSTPRTPSAGCARRTRCRPPPPTTPSAARTCARASTCSRRSPPSGGRGVAAWQRLNRKHRTIGGRGAQCPAPTPSTCSTRRWSAPGPSTPTRLRAYMLKAVARGQGPHLLDQPQRALRRGARAVRRGHPRSRAVGAPSWTTSAPSRPAWPTSARSTRSAQTLIKITAPGVPDFYQGTELWDLSLVDPDNRRPVDWDAAAARCSTSCWRPWPPRRDRAALAHELVKSRHGRPREDLRDPRVARVPRARRRALFETGDYRPLEVRGALGRARLRLRARGGDGGAALTVIPRLLARRGIDALPLGAELLGRHLARAARRRWPAATRTCSRASGVEHGGRRRGRRLPLGAVLADLPGGPARREAP